MPDGYMTDNATIEVTGLDERIKKFGEASTKNPMMRKRINEVIRTALREVKKKLQNEAKSGLDMQSDPRKAYKAVRMGNWFGNASLRELERQASNIDAMIDNILEGILY